MSISEESDVAAVDRRTALCLSGGGFRAALFHLGAMRRLNELGVLSKLDTITSVSGGSILAAHLATHVRPWPEQGASFGPWQEMVEAPFFRFVKNNIRTWPVLKRFLLPWNWFRPSTQVRALEACYHRHLTSLTLPNLPERPNFVFCATDMTFGVSWVFEKSRVGSYQAGYATPAPAWPVAKAVAASSCFPPVFSPLPIKDGQKAWHGMSLSDGGLYDNLGLQPVEKHGVVLVSDGGQPFVAAVPKGMSGRVKAYLAVSGKQAGALRKRLLIGHFQDKVRQGTYWGIGSAVCRYRPDAKPGYGKEFATDTNGEVRRAAWPMEKGWLLPPLGRSQKRVYDRSGKLAEEVPMPCYRFHPVCLLFPKLGQDELEELAEDIKAKGLLRDIVRYKGEILDGRNRLAACEIARVKPRFVEWQGEGSPTEWVISENLIRRHLSSSQRAVIAHDLLPLLEREAKERQHLSAGRGKKGTKRLVAFSGNGHRKGKSSQIAARLAKTNSAYIEAVKAISRQAPDLLEEIRSGHLKIPDATILSKMPKAKRRKVVKMIRASGPEQRVGDNGKMCRSSNGITARSIVGDSDHRRDNDRYYTQLREIDALLGVEKFSGETLDPCAGDGRIVRRLRQRGCRATGTDIQDGTDFFATARMVDNIVTNPPWDRKDDFILRAMRCARRHIALLLPLFALSGIRRLREIYSNRRFPLKCVYVISHRLQFDPDAGGGSTIVGGWFVWQRGYRGEPTIRWLP